MIRTFCDICDNELTEHNSVKGGTGRLQRLCHTSHPIHKSSLMFEITTGIIGGAWNSGDFCKYCVIDAINELDDRTKAGCVRAL